MITLEAYRGKKIGVFGLGKSGEATVAALLSGGADVYVWDDGEKSRDALVARYGSKVRLETIARWPWPQLSALVLSPGVPLTHPAPHPVVYLARNANVEVIGDIELLYRACPDATYVGITGTNGKSTTTSLIAHILKTLGREVAVGGNLGTPVLSLPMIGSGGIYVLETSSYQLDLLKSTRFNVAVFLNITPDHLDRHGDMEGYVAAKMHIFDRMQAGDTAVVAVDDEYTREIVERGTWNVAGASVMCVSAQSYLTDGIYVQQGLLYDTACHVPRTTFHDFPTLQGQHNWQNAAAAYAACRALGCAPEEIIEAMRSFPGLPHRMELVATIDGVRFINDSKATNADAAEKALVCYAPIYWIVGGKPKAGGIEALTPHFSRIAKAFLIGEAAEEFAQTLHGKVEFEPCGTLEVAVSRAADAAIASGNKNAVVLLSPACASFDQFKSFEERGDKFREYVARFSLPESRATGNEKRKTPYAS